MVQSLNADEDCTLDSVRASRPPEETRMPIRLLTFSTLYPNAAHPQHGVFVENRLRHLVDTGRVTTTVLAPVPWFPFKSPAFGAYARYARVPDREIRFGLEVLHPRYVVIPKVGMTVSPLLLYLSARAAIRHLLARGQHFDAIDAHYFYPDGIAATLLGREFNAPVCITGRGTDLNQIPKHYLPGMQIKWAAREAAALVTVCQSLKERLIALGADQRRIRVLRNGVDLVQFRPLERESARRSQNLAGLVLLSVGALIPRKGHDLTIGALAEIPGASLLIAGEGPYREMLERTAQEFGVRDRVTFLGQVSHEQLPNLYNCADILVLSSSSEGWANVLLEAMACGTPVVATNVSGTPEVVTEAAAGLLVDQRTPQGIAQKIRELLDNLPSRESTRAYAEQFSWEETTEGQLNLFTEIISRHTQA